MPEKPYRLFWLPEGYLYGRIPMAVQAKEKMILRRTVDAALTLLLLLLMVLATKNDIVRVFTGG